jgi:MHS family proline/betaine transporter-like MFS transporter
MEIKPTTRVLLAAGIGNIVEWYDFGLYGLLAPVLASVFFPSHDRIAALIGVYGGFAVGFAMRPIGAIVLGRVGDWRGRQFVLVLSVAIMGISTVAVGLLPSYDEIGIWAPILLIVIRLFQGFSVGGEFVGSVTYLVETAPAGRRGIAGSIANIGATIGMLLAAGAGLLAETYTAGFTHLWRVAFLFGGVLAMSGYLLRRHLPPEQGTAEDVVVREELAAREQNSREQAPGALENMVARWPALRAFRKMPRTMIIAMTFTCGYGITNYLTMVFLPTFGREFANIRQDVALRINTVGQALALVIVPLAGWISDGWIRRRTLIAAAFLFQGVLAWESFVRVLKTGVGGLWLAQLVSAALLAVVMGTAPAMLAEQFPRGYRVSAHALVLNVGIGIAGGTAPMVAVAMIRASENRMAPAAYLLAACLVSGVSILLLQDHSRESL